MLTHLKNSHRNNKQTGLTLIEVMVAVAIVAILAAIAGPEYLSQSRKNVRTEAISALTRIQIEVDRCYGINGGYHKACCPDATVIGNVLTVQSPITDNGNYTITYTPNTPTGNIGCKNLQGYTLTATPLGDQLNDTNCLLFTLDEQGNRTATNPSCWTDQ